MKQIKQMDQVKNSLRLSDSDRKTLLAYSDVSAETFQKPAIETPVEQHISDLHI